MVSAESQLVYMGVWEAFPKVPGGDRGTSLPEADEIK